MTMPVARVSEALFQNVLGADAHAVEKAVLDHQTIGEPDITKVVTRMAELFDTTKGDTYNLLGITSSRVSRSSNMNVEVLDRAGSAIKLFARVAAMIGEESAADWFKSKNGHLNDKRPLDLLNSSLGRQRLASMITALEDGSFL